jgi:hypothetical protein
MVDPGTAAIIAGGIGAVATIAAAIIGRRRGQRKTESHRMNRHLLRPFPRNGH